MARPLLKLIALSLIALFFLSAKHVLGQSGQYNVQFKMNSYDCEQQKLFVDVEVQAHSPNTIFNISDQNFRFSFNRNAVTAIQGPAGSGSTSAGGGGDNDDEHFSVRISQEMELSGFVFEGPTVSFFDPHTLNGSMDTVVSYNVPLAGGAGFPVVGTAWTKVGRLEFNLLNASSCLELTWHTHHPDDFPPTFIGEKFQGVLFEATEGNYTDLAVCLSDFCSTPLPVEMTHFEGYSEGCDITLDWATASEEENDYFILEKSADGIAFEEVARIAGHGTTQEEHNYRYTDVATAVNQYYRLIQVNFDGERTDSETISVTTGCFGENPGHDIAVLFPNPVRQGKVTMEYYAGHESGNGEIIITDLMGRRMQTLSHELKPGLNILQFDTDRLAPGTYFVEVSGEGWYSVSRKFVKLR